MPPLPPVPNTVKVVFNYDNTVPGGGKEIAANVMHVQYAPTLAFTATELTAVANGAFTWWSTHFAPSISNAWRLNGVSATALDGSGVQGVSTHAAAAGTNAGTPLPPAASVCVSWLGAPSYRGGKPRTYLPGIPNTAQSTTVTSALSSTYATTLKTAAIAALADMSWTTIAASVASLGAVSYINKALNPTPPHHRTTPLFYIFLTAQVHERMDSQRRRNGKERNYPVT